MANSKWGNKRTCLGCGKRFYDMRRELIICPGCETPFEISPPGRVRRQRAVAQPQVVAPAKPPPEVNAKPEAETSHLAAGQDETAGTEDIADVEEKAAETIEYPAELGEDEDDVAEVLVGMEESDKVGV